MFTIAKMLRDHSVKIYWHNVFYTHLIKTVAISFDL